MWVLGFLGPIWSVSEPQMDVFGALLGRFGTVDLELSAGGGADVWPPLHGDIIARPFANIKATQIPHLTSLGPLELTAVFGCSIRVLVGPWPVCWRVLGSGPTPLCCSQAEKGMAQPEATWLSRLQLMHQAGNLCSVRLGRQRQYSLTTALSNSSYEGWSRARRMISGRRAGVPSPGPEGRSGRSALP